MITAVVQIKTERQRIEEVAQNLMEIPGVAEVYSVSGDYDLLALISVSQYEEISGIVTEKLIKLGGIKETNTMMAFRCYSKHDLEKVWGIGLEK